MTFKSLFRGLLRVVGKIISVPFYVIAFVGLLIVGFSAMCLYVIGEEMYYTIGLKKDDVDINTPINELDQQ